MGNLRQSMTEEEWNELGIPKNALLRTINTDNEEDILSKMVSHPAHYGGKDNPYEAINHPEHYGGENNPYEAIKVIEAYDFDFITGNIVKYLFRHKKKNGFEDLKKAQWYMTRLVEREQKKIKVINE